MKRKSYTNERIETNSGSFVGAQSHINKAHTFACACNRPPALEKKLAEMKKKAAEEVSK